MPAAARTLLDVARGGAVGAVEVVPGVSGGTVAIVVGIYETLLDSLGRVSRAVSALATDLPRRRGTARAREHLVAVRWDVVLPVAAGMVTAVLVAARFVAPVVEAHPAPTRALFAGLVLASVAIPARMVGGRWRGREVALAVTAAACSFALAGLPPATVSEPSRWAVGGAAALAVCALVMPGLSGSFVLLVLGLYESTLGALNDRDLAYVATFGLGAALGIGVFVRLLQRLLARHRRTTLAVMTGVMAGSVRALWPWQADDATMLAPDGPVGLPVLLFVLGLVVVGGVVVASRHHEGSRARGPRPER